MNPLFLILAIPLLEIAVFVEVGSLIGTWPTVLLIFLSMLGGMALLRAQGQAVLERVRGAAARGEPPVGAALETFCVVAGAILLIIPGFLTDLLALGLIFPMSRNFLGRWMFRQYAGRSGVWMGGSGFGPGPGGGQTNPSDIIDGEFRTVDEDPVEPDDAEKANGELVRLDDWRRRDKTNGDEKD